VHGASARGRELSSKSAASEGAPAIWMEFLAHLASNSNRIRNGSVYASKWL
jgi:hypothetical protein